MRLVKRELYHESYKFEHIIKIGYRYADMIKRSKQYVIDAEQAEKVSFDIKNMLLQMKGGKNEVEEFFSEFLSYNGYQKTAFVLLEVC